MAGEEGGRGQKEELRLQRCQGQIRHSLAGWGKEPWRVHYVRVHERGPSELQLLLLPDLSRCRVTSHVNPTL